jgi:phosphoribosylglycinamide formyltransferase 1
MKIVIFTSNAIRHMFVANALAAHCQDALVVSECKESDNVEVKYVKRPLSPIEEHFFLRYKTEKEFFQGNDAFIAQTLPLIYKEGNLPFVARIVKKFAPDSIVAFGCSILAESLLSMVTPGRFVNLHLGLSPYYRGSGTNFWPFVNKELEYVGSTLLHIDAGVDTGDIIAHVRPHIEMGDDVHTVGCKVIKESTDCLLRILVMIHKGKQLPRVKQWDVPHEKYYKKSDFNEGVLEQYRINLEQGLIEDYLKNPQEKLRIISL